MGRTADVKLLVQSAMIFFGTLMAAGLVALGEPTALHGERSALHRTHETSTQHALNQVVEFARPWIDTVSTQGSR